MRTAPTVPLAPCSVLASAQVACGAASSFCTMVGGQLMAWGKLKTTDNTMYPKAFQDLSGWRVRSMACGASTYAVAATAGSEESTITWRALLQAGPVPRPPHPCPCMACCPCHKPLKGGAEVRGCCADVQGPGAQRRAGLRRQREEVVGQRRQVLGVGGRARRAGERPVLPRALLRSTAVSGCIPSMSSHCHRSLRGR